jgi:hypothetical protein
MIDEKIFLVITSELTGQAQDDELDFLKDWLSESKENARLYHSYKEAFLNGKYKLEAKHSDAAYKKLSEALHFKTYEVGTGNGSGKKLQPHHRFDWFRKYAAILLILITTSLIIYKTSDMWRTGAENKIDHELIVKSNPRGVKSLVVLPDGSKVKLNSESHLEYYSDFDQERSVKLIGEAFFEIEKDELRPFTVSSVI